MARMATVQEQAGQAAQKAAGVVQRGREIAREKMKHPLWGIPAFYIGFTAASIVASLVLFARKDRENAIFVGLWPPTILGLGLFHKVVVGMRESTQEE